jgi:hypothetical protein
MAHRIWAIKSWTVGFPNSGGIIESSRGRPYNELRKIARRMCFNGDGQRYAVVEVH